jgi:hypothetical protein
MKENKLSIGFIVITITLIMGFIAPNEWYLLESKICGYTVKFPQMPKKSIQEVDSEIGKLKMEILMYDDALNGGKDDNKLYLVSYTEYPISKVNADNKQMLPGFYRKAIDGAVNNYHGKLLSEKAIELKGYSGREIVISFEEDKIIANMRLFLVKNKMYTLETMTEANKSSNLSINRFMNSFDLMNK